MREIVSLQLGQLSNYTATHFWNAQVTFFTNARLAIANRNTGVIFYILG
jgi:hypothetical protein